MQTNNTELKIPDALSNFDQLPNSAYIRLPVLLGLFSVSEASIWRWVKKGAIPKPVKLSVRTSAWNVGEIRNVLQAKFQ